MKKLLIISFIFSLTVFSCDLFLGLLPDGGGYSTRQFWAQDLVSGNYYRLTAELLAENGKCQVWVERGSGVTESMAREIANTYINIIYPGMMNTFGWVSNLDDEDEDGRLILLDYPNSSHDYYNTMEIADALADGNGKMTILLLDIRDGFTPGNAYTAGYFYAYDLYDGAQSNQCDMIYMDTYPSLAFNTFPSLSWESFYGTLAHEMQHLMNFVTRLITLVGAPDEDIFLTDTWLNEGLSEMAEWVYSGTPSQSRVNTYNNDSTGYIAKGDNFFSWENHYNSNIPETINTSLNDYATVNLFFNWLRIHYGNGILREISRSRYHDYRAISELAFNLSHGGALTRSDLTGDDRWLFLLTEWYAANYLNNPTGVLGYGNDSVLKNVKAPYLNSNGAATWPLYPCEAVYSYSSMGRSIQSDGNGWYYGIGNNQLLDFVPAGGALLSLNIDTYIKRSGSEPAITSTFVFVTGETPPVAAASVQSSNSRSALQFNGMYAISAGEMLRRNGFGRGNFDIPVRPQVIGNNIMEK